MKTNFEIIGYNIDIYFNKKYFGSIPIEKPDREVMGYTGRKTEILEKDFSYKNKKLKAGVEVVTECIPLCGRLKGTLEEKKQLLFRNKQIFNY
jgi:hypothetical protein